MLVYFTAQVIKQAQQSAQPLSSIIISLSASKCRRATSSETFRGPAYRGGLRHIETEETIRERLSRESSLG